jgi:predicted transcriptional regulator
MKASDAMVPFVALERGATWSEVAECIERCGLAQVPIVEAGQVVGWVGDRELRVALAREGWPRRAAAWLVEDGVRPVARAVVIGPVRRLPRTDPP